VSETQTEIKSHRTAYITSASTTALVKLLTRQFLTK
jgi:hypothetical protein